MRPDARRVFEEQHASTHTGRHHPDADAATGMVTLPNVNPLTEMVDMMTASRGYESGLAAFRISTQMAEKTISMGSGNA